jgi:hypothetical protein
LTRLVFFARFHNNFGSINNSKIIEGIDVPVFLAESMEGLRTGAWLLPLRKAWKRKTCFQVLTMFIRKSSSAGQNKVWGDLVTAVLCF